MCITYIYIYTHICMYMIFNVVGGRVPSTEVLLPRIARQGTGLSTHTLYVTCTLHHMRAELIIITRVLVISTGNETHMARSLRRQLCIRYDYDHVNEYTPSAFGVRIHTRQYNHTPSIRAYITTMI